MAQRVGWRLISAAAAFLCVFAGSASGQGAIAAAGPSAIAPDAAQRTPGAQAAAKKALERVVVQVSDGDPKTWNQALNVINHLQIAYGKDGVQIELVAFGNGIGMLQIESEVGNRIKQTLAAGTQVAACMNTMRGRKLAREDMLSAISFVPSGVVELVSKQRAGWVVIRP